MWRELPSRVANHVVVTGDYLPVQDDDARHTPRDNPDRKDKSLYCTAAPDMRRPLHMSAPPPPHLQQHTNSVSCVVCCVLTRG